MNPFSTDDDRSRPTHAQTDQLFPTARGSFLLVDVSRPEARWIESTLVVDVVA